jgi:type VI secretion system protein ImpA
MPDLDIDSLLAPIAGDGPCGVDLEYDPAFQTLLELTAGKPERHSGSTIIPATPPEWPAVREQALQVAARTRDLRVAVWLIRTAAHTDGLAGAVRGLQLLRGLIEKYWDHVHPLLDASDNNDPTARLSALSPLIHSAGLNDLRAAGLTTSRGAVTVRDLELAFGHVEPMPGEAAPTEEGITPAVAAAIAQTPTLAETMASGLEAVQAMAKLLDDHLGAANAPELSPLIKLMQCVANAGAVAQGGAAVAVDSADTAHAANNSAARQSSGAGAINSREDAIRTLQRVCDWIERNEPTNPAPLLIQRAQRLMKKNFMEIIRDLLPDGLGQIEKLAGPSGD